MAPVYKLTYFNFMGRGEPIRYMLSYGGIEFEDIRIPLEEWPALKPSIQFGQLPILEVDGKKLNQSIAICRYLAKQLKLNGKDDWASSEIDSIVDTIQDMRSKITAYFYNNETEEKKEKMLEVLMNETFPYYLERFEAIAKANNKYFVGGEMSWADILFVCILEYTHLRFNKDLIENYTSLKALRENVLDHPGIKSWIAKRPKTPY